MLNDLDYYNGIVFQGYVQGAPRVVLSGGRTTTSAALRQGGRRHRLRALSGRADRVLLDKPAWDADVLALYAENDDPAKVNEASFALAAQGLRVLAAASAPPISTPKRRWSLTRNLPGGAQRMLNIALPKGRLGIKPTASSATAGTSAPRWSGMTAAWCCPKRTASTVPAGQAQRRAHLRGARRGGRGRGGKDVLLEGGNDVYERSDLGFGVCRMCVAAP
jgi:ATP phosphoribosyltransferase regulatory subunit